MKKIKVFSLLLALVLLTVALAQSSIWADTSTTKVPNEPILSEGFDAHAASGTHAGGSWSHGNNQNRIVTVSDASYLGVLTGDTEEGYTVAMIQVHPDGTCRTITTGEIQGVSTTITIMADKNENIWMYSGWDIGSGFFETRLWFYDTKADQVTNFEKNLSYTKGGNFGYSVAIMDPSFNRIYAIAGGGDAPAAFFAWGVFNIDSGEWEKKMLSYKTGERYCYHYGYPDGKGGFIVVDERDITNAGAFSNLPETRVSEAMKTYRSRKIDAGYMWDIPKLILVPDVTDKNCVVVRTVEEYAYDVENGLYPNVLNGSNDMLVVGNYLYILLTLDDAGRVGRRTSLHVLDMTDDYKEVASADINFIEGINTKYCPRLFLDTHGNLFILANRSGSRHLEIWQACNDLKTEYKLIAEKSLNFAAASIIISSSRNNSVSSDVASFFMEANSTYYFLNLDFSPLYE